MRIALDTNAYADAARGADRCVGVLRAADEIHLPFVVPTNDLWIAALVLQHDLLLLTNDTHFDRIPQVPRA